MMKDLGSRPLGALEIARAIAQGELTAEAATRSCLETCAAREEAIGAWVHLDPEAALATARSLDAGPSRGRLHGVPLGVKDIFAVRDMPWRCGSPIWRDRVAGFDAGSVALARSAGAVILGKTETTEFAGYQPSRTRNPVVAGATPGGSSSGSAAAVAAGMVPLAFGTQTSGSVIRPAAFCGVVGFKPSFDLIETGGISVFARSFDTVGVFARSVPDAALGVEALTGLELQPEAEAPTGRLTLFRSPVWDAAEPAMQGAWEAFEAQVSAALTPGATAFSAELSAAMAEIPALHARLMAVEASEALAHEVAIGADLLSQGLRAQIAEGAALSPAQRLADRAAMQGLRARVMAATLPGEIWLTPATAGPAPAFESGTGNPIFNRIWSLLGFPCCTVPILSDAEGRPMGVQVVGRHGEDRAVLSRAQWLMERFAT
ncbi:Asp-tRNA(Asn)/Glu-tRNA(Gln) amidotransferase A subunit family amidase [Rhodobacter sp. 140A]|uniref:Putative amidase AmiD n=1 Tax=bioreactor metagenome TaxID=1076179 RepID=A0A644WYI8_9ZZZZ|nr:Asp-tRNA(Asn)/Glu-tRNA(Gln) amidotransferase A subunit family amidase [Rhodobacter sp. 140A]